MAELYNRIIRVNVAGFEIEHPRMHFNVERQPDDTPPNGQLTIYNLADREDREIFKRDEPVVIRAGYPQQLGIVFEGKVAKIVKQRRGTERTTQLDLIGGLWDSGLESSPPVTSRSHAGEQSVREVAKAIVTQDMGMAVGDISVIPEDATVDNFYAVNNSTVALTMLTSRVGVTWYEDDGVVRFHSPRRYRNDTSRLLIAERTGLLKGTAYSDSGEEDSGYRVKTLLNPLVRIDGIVDLESKEVLGGKGTFKIANFRHDGDNWEGDFCTEMELVELAEGTVQIGPLSVVDDTLPRRAPGDTSPTDPQPTQSVMDLYRPGDTLPEGAPAGVERVTYFSNYRQFTDGKLTYEGPAYKVRYDPLGPRRSQVFTEAEAPSWVAGLRE